MDQQPGPSPTLRETKSKLLEAAQAAIADQRTKAGTGQFARARSRWGRDAFRVVLGLLLVAGALVLTARPAWLAGPPMPAETAEVKHASVTLSLVEAMGHVTAYFEANGRLPATLLDAGVINPQIGYHASGDARFSLTLQTEDSTLTLSSTDSLKPLIVNAIRALQRRS